MALDLYISQAVMAAKSMERAAHDPGPWFISWNGQTVVAQRHLSDDSIHLTAHLHGRGEDSALLICRGETVGVRQIISTEDGCFDMIWTFGIEVILA